MKRLASLVAVALLIWPATAQSQSLLSARGLGLPLDALDARARAMGGVSLGTLWPGVLPGQPTAALDILQAGVAFTASPSWGDYSLGDDSGNFRGARFPVLGFSIPVGLRNVLTVTAGSAYDQRWSVSREGSALFDGTVIPTEDRFTSDGGISTAQVGFARWMSRSLAIGLSVGLYRGQVTRTFTRQFDTTSVSTPITPFVSSGKWSYFGPTVSVDALWDPSQVLRVGARISWSGTLEASPVGNTEGGAREASLPLDVGLGLTAILSPNLSLALGAETASWSDIDGGGLDEVAAGRVNTFGAGLEWRAGDFWAGDFPLRIGYRRAELPFLFDGDSSVESALTGGFSVVLAEIQEFPRAIVDFAAEWGSRDSGSLSESFRRLSVTFRVSGI